MTPTIAFIITAGMGFISTAIILIKAQKSVNLSSHQYALIVSLSLGITAAGSFFIPLAVSRSHAGLNMPLVVFGLLHAFVWGILAYLVARIFLKIRVRDSTSEKR